MRKVIGELKPGDEVVVENFYRLRSVQTVDRVTNFAVFVGGDRFNRDTGKIYSGGFGKPLRILLTDNPETDVDGHNRKVRLAKDISDALDRLSLGKLEEIWGMVKGA